MAILFVTGIMNLAWMAALSLLMFTEKVSVRGLAVGKVAGIMLIAVGVAIVAYTIL
jgi:predicted metal-binding membrane protein